MPAPGQAAEWAAPLHPAAYAMQPLSISSNVVMSQRLYIADAHYILCYKGVLQLTLGKAVADGPMEEHGAALQRNVVVGYKLHEVHGLAVAAFAAHERVGKIR